jgi:hypothetical protein
MLHHRGVKPILIALSIVFLVTGGIFTIVGSGGGGGDDSPSQGAARLKVSVWCGGTNVVEARLVIGGKELKTSSGRSSNCRFFPPGTYNARGVISSPRCGTYRANVTTTITENCTNNFDIVPGSGAAPVLRQTKNCPGSCIGPASVETEQQDSISYETGETDDAIIAEFSLEEDGIEPFTSE